VSAVATDPRSSTPVPLGWLPEGAVAVPGFVDHHMHLFATAAARLSVDVGPAVAGDIGELIAVLAAAAERVPGGEWIRGWGHDEAFLAERRHPTAAELDRATDRHPVVLRDRTGHVSVVNSKARALLGATVRVAAPPIPAGGVLVDAEDVLAAVPPASPSAAISTGSRSGTPSPTSPSPPPARSSPRGSSRPPSWAGRWPST
jgi:predicted amidohydrolase YtcJ